MPRVTVVVPVLARPQNVDPLLESFGSSLGAIDAGLLFVADSGDREEIGALHAADADVLILPGSQSYPQKINAAYRETDSPWLFLAADDVAFRPGWLEAGLEHDVPGVDVIGTNDLGNARTIDGTHSTHTFVRRAYADDPGATWDRPGTVLHEGYRHWYVDDELCAVAQTRGVYVHAAGCIVEHFHPYHGKAADDSTYRRGARAKNRDRATFRGRQRLWT